MAPVRHTRCKSTSKVTAVLGNGHSRFALCSDQAVESNKLIVKEGFQSGLGEENCSSRMTRPTAGLSGVREE